MLVLRLKYCTNISLFYVIKVLSVFGLFKQLSITGERMDNCLRDARPGIAWLGHRLA